MKKIICVLMAVMIPILCVSCTSDDGEITTTAENSNVAAEPNSKANATYTGFPAMEEIKFTVSDPDNSKSLPTKKIEHSYGVAKDGKPNQISVDSENFFETKGYKAVTYDTKSDKKLLYLTFDCGYENGYTAKILDTLKEKNVKATFFCTLSDIKSEPELIARMIKEGHIVGNHSTTHKSFPELTRTQMAQEIEECDNFLRTNFGYTSKFFRFPKGEYSESALDLVASIGFVSVFWSLSYADWDTSSQKGSDYAFKNVTARLHPGAVILLHSVSSDNAGAIGRIIDYAREQGYEFSSIDNIQTIK